jgi:RimJ/RimL family protein N-acetyltransferase
VKPVSELTFRTATTGDIPILRALADRIWRASYQEMLTSAQMDYMLGWMYSTATLEREMAEGVRYELAELRGKPVGYSALSYDSELHRAELHKLYLAPELQGRGFGQVMLQAALAQAAKLGAGEVRLRVNRHNARALRAYDRAGFQIESELCQDIGGGFVMDDFVMVRPLIVGD